MNVVITNLIIIFIVAFAISVWAEDEIDRVIEYQQISKENYKIQYFLGTWKQLAESYDESGQKSNFNGTLTVENMYQDKYLIFNSELDFQYQSFYKKVFIGYDKYKSKYILISFDDSQFTPYISYGEYDAELERYTFPGEVYNPKLDKLIKVKWIYEINSDVTFTYYNYSEDDFGNMRLRLKIVNAKIP